MIKQVIDQNLAVVEKLNLEYGKDKAVDKQLQKAKAKAKALNSLKLRL